MQILVSAVEVMLTTQNNNESILFLAEHLLNFQVNF